MRLTPGTRFGQYEILTPLGAGGMGEVYRARDTKLGRDVAIKVLPSPFTTDSERLARFEREARTLASLNHPGIGAIYGLEHTSSGGHQPVFPALIPELVEGETLADLVRRGPIALPTALDVARQIADALDVAHERNIVHRDLKPANIKITPDGIVKILDFGLARAFANDSDDSQGDPSKSPTVTSSGTREGVILGTAAYMSPEQARGKAVDRRADIWAFGCVLYEMLTAKMAFSGDSISDVIVAVLDREPDFSALPAATPERIRVLLRRCFQKNVRRRLRDIAEARMDIDDVIAGPAIDIRTSGPIATGRPRQPLWQIVSILAPAFAAAIGAGWLVAQAQRREATASPAFDRVIRLISTPAHEFGPVISPDGKWVAYLSNARGPTDVWVKFIAGGDPRNLTASSDITVQSQDWIGGLAVSPDGSQIAFQAQAPAQQSVASWVMPSPLGGAPRRAVPPGNSGIQWSPDGKRIAYVKTGGSLGDSLMVADSDGQNELEIVKRQGARHVHWIRWDHAGRFVYFNHSFQNFNTEPTEIFRAPVSGGTIERVVGTARRAAFPFPSLVGNILEIRQSLQRVAVTFDRPVTLEALTDGFSGDVDPAWSPDGTRLVFSSARTGNRTLWTAGPDLTQLAPLTSGVSLDERPVYSPDGQQIAFVSDRKRTPRHLAGQRRGRFGSRDCGCGRRRYDQLVARWTQSHLLDADRRCARADDAGRHERRNRPRPNARSSHSAGVVATR